MEFGILARGFLPLRYDDCGHDKWVACSCKRRGCARFLIGPAELQSSEADSGAVTLNHRRGTP